MQLDLNKKTKLTKKYTQKIVLNEFQFTVNNNLTKKKIK